MNFRHLGFGAALITLVASVSQAQENQHQLKLDLDPLLDAAKIWSLTPETLESQFKAEGFSENPYIRWNPARTVASFLKAPFSNVSVDLSILAGKVAVTEAALTFDKTSGKPQRGAFEIASPNPETTAMLRSAVTAMLGTEPKAGPRPVLGWKADVAVKSEVWSGAKGSAILQVGQGLLRLAIGAPGMDGSTAGMAVVHHSAGEERPTELKFFVRLDGLFTPPTVWGMTPDDVEKATTLPGVSLTSSPFFKWNTASKDSARFSHKLFSNTETDLLLFDDAVNAEEANIEFKDGRAAKIIYTLLTRGNSGDGITAAQFDAVFKATGRALGTTLGVRPTRTTVAGKSLTKTEGWLWTTPHTLALMEFNVDAPKGKVEFLRLTLTPAKARAELLNLAGLGNNATTRARSSLVSSLKRDASTGDVEIVGVPMRDQGQKGYCVAASCERLFRYLGVPCDMDELAQLVSADAERGASPSVMYSSLTKIDQRYNMRVKLLKIPPGYGLGSALKSQSELERAQRAELPKLIRESIDQGLPLLWCVMLAPGESGVSPGTETKPRQESRGPRVGHMRLITGYNSKTGGVIYTDSWGAGHERKVMPLSEANEMTTAVFSMAPSR